MFVRLNEVNYHVQVIGDGEPLLLLHGFTGSLKSWLPFVEEWGRSFKLILVDLLGHGLTDHPKDFERYSTEYAVSDLVTLLDELKIESAHILGYSMGGRLALSLSLTYPERVRSLILESSSPGLESEEERLSRKLSDQSLAEKIERDGIEAFVDFWGKIPLFATQEKILTYKQRETLRADRLQNHEQGLANSLRGMGTGSQSSWWAYLHRCQLPVLLVVGEHDQKYLKINQEMKYLLSNAQLVIVKGAGHTIHLEQSVFFGTIIMDYLKGGNKDGSRMGSKTSI